MAAPAPTPAGPRNLARPLAEWLRRQGFTVVEREQPLFVALQAHWVSAQGERFQLDYTWASGPVPEAHCQLQVIRTSPASVEPLLTAQRVRRLKEVRLLLLNNVRYHNARLLAKPAPQTT